MSENPCPNCGESLPRDAINVAEGVALCDACGRLSRLSDVAARRRPVQAVLDDPPAGCRVERWGHEIRVRASLRSLKGAVGAAAITLFWNGIVSVFVLLAASGLYRHFIGPPPAWFPGPEEGLKSFGETLFLCVFLIPFVAIGATMIAVLLLTIAGRVEVAIAGVGSSVATGIGWLSYRRRFDADQTTSVALDKSSLKSEDQSTPVIKINANGVIKFGMLLPEERLDWMLVVLQQMLTEPDVDRESLARELMNSRTRRG
ncbi:hypothetical protein Pla123a_41600 [Posidoniimonas polymericola]|uniref:Uncharacterized protein n=1 Tax=Posidoniimonas polymericola TaxID=2528002 RepID=A0A5C5XXK5_9BACT|nr:hypothetical protein [Posidoniimonas polymericola]TWT67604.1 hypothetical protein Pla123a_41600 [Posidoniimonas polymericola]